LDNEDWLDVTEYFMLGLGYTGDLENEYSVDLENYSRLTKREN